MNATQSGLVPNQDQQGGSIQKSSVTGSESQSIVETATASAAAQVTAEIQAHFMIAQHRQRSMLQVRERLMDECARPSFAAVAMYAKKQGKRKDETGRWVDNYVTGLSIRFAEAAQRAMGNMLVRRTTIYDDERKRIVMVSVTDLETNAMEADQVTIDKTVERKSNKGRTVLGDRLNGYGDIVYVVEATADEVFSKERSLTQKVKRNLILGMVPGDVKEACERQIDLTTAREFNDSPDEVRRKVADWYRNNSISLDDLKEYLGHSLETATREEIADLRGLAAAIKEGSTTWREAMERRREEFDGGLEAPAKSDAKPEPKSTKKAAPPKDELDAEVESIHEAIGAATTSLELSALLKRIDKLPEPDKGSLTIAYTARKKELDG